MKRILFNTLLSTLILEIGASASIAQDSNIATDQAPAGTEVPAESAEDTAGKALGNVDIAYLEDPSRIALEFVRSFRYTLTEKTDYTDASLIKLDVDALIATAYHPRLHANASLGLAYNFDYKVRIEEAGPNNMPPPLEPPYWLIIGLQSGIESAPVKPATGDDLDWETFNDNISLDLSGKVPYTDYLSGLVGNFTGSRGFAGGLIFTGAFKYLNQEQVQPDQDDGFRSDLKGTWAIPFLANSEIFLTGQHSFGGALDSSKSAYSIELSMRLEAKLKEFFSKLLHDADGMRVFVRYFDGEIAPSFQKANGFEFGIGSRSLWK